MNPSESLDALVAEVRALRADINVLQGGQRTPLASSAAVTNPDYEPNFGFEYGVWGNAVSIQSTFSNALALATVAFSRVGPLGGGVFGVEDLGARIIVSGGDPIATFDTFGYGQPYLDVFTINMIAHAGFADSDTRNVDLQIIEYQGEGSGATYPLAFVSASLFVIPVTAYT